MIRKAKINEYRILTQISFNSKGYWNYPDEYFNIWEKELTITQNYILNNDVYVYEQNDCISGYYSLVELQKDLILSGVRIEAGTWLEHMFILPALIRKGIGKKLFLHCIEQCHSKVLKILADPNARFFYEKMGCNFIKEYPSTIEGRTTPYLEYNFKNC